MLVEKYSNTIKKENTSLAKRKYIIKNNIEKKLQLKCAKNKVPKIAICCSGGGFRSMLATAGFLTASKKINLLDSTSYITTISGSTWFLAPWTMSKYNIESFTNNLILKLDYLNTFKNPVKLRIKEFRDIKNFISQSYLALSKLKEAKKTSVVDLYGILLSSFLFSEFKEKKFNLKLSDLQTKIYTGNYPFPMFLATSQLNNYEYQWLEFSPYYIASQYLDSIINPKYFGTILNNGKIQNKIEELPLSSLIGIFGSAFSSNIKDAIHRAVNIASLQDFKKLLKKTEDTIFYHNWANKKIFPAQITNFTFGMPNSPIKEEEHLEVVDGGYSCNIPIQPLLHPKRKVDIIIVLDNTNQKFLSPAFSLKEAEKQAKENNVKFPPIDYKKAQNQNFSVFEDKNDSECPTIIYIPLRKEDTYNKKFDPYEEKFCNATNFFYSAQQAKKLVGLTKHMAYKYQDDIWRVVKSKVMKKHRSP